MPQSGEETATALRAQVDALNEEIAHLRTRMADAPKRVRALEERLLETKGQLAQAVAQKIRCDAQATPGGRDVAHRLEDFGSALPPVVTRVGQQ